MLGPEFGTFRWLFRSSMKLQVSVLRQKLGSQGYRPTGGPALGRCRGHHATTAAACLQWDRRSAGFGSIRFARWFTEVWLHGEHISDVGCSSMLACKGMGWTHRVFQDFLDISCCVTMICSCRKQQLPHNLQPTEPLVSRHLLHMDNILYFASSASSAFFFWSIWNYLKLEVGFVIGFLYFSQETIGNPEIHMN
jgi:hypothetical protein